MSNQKNNFTSEWNNYYSNDKNSDIPPPNEVVNFLSQFILNESHNQTNNEIVIPAKRVIDVGCGRGANLLLGDNMGIEMYGVDISEKAVEISMAALEEEIGSLAHDRLLVSDIGQLPWTDCFFTGAISTNTLDSMTFKSAQAGLPEIARVTKEGGYFFCSLISGDSLENSTNFCGEELVQNGSHTQTVISYFNRTKVRRLIEPLFEILSCDLHEVSNPKIDSKTSQWNIIAKRR